MIWHSWHSWHSCSTLPQHAAKAENCGLRTVVDTSTPIVIVLRRLASAGRQPKLVSANEEFEMKDIGRLLWLAIGLLIGAGAVALWTSGTKPVEAGNDRHEDYILCTGPVAALQRVPTDGVWMLDYRTGRLLGTVIDRAAGKLIGWAEVDLV